jgi:hydrogenase/urease accessory protein HupE
LKRLFLCVVLLALTVTTIRADVYNPAYLEFKQTSNDTFDMLWKVPAQGPDKRLGLYVEFPEDIKTIIPVRTTFVGSAFIETSTIKRVNGLSGAEIVIDGLADISTEVLVRIERLDGSTEVARLTPAASSFVVTATPDFWEVARTYLLFGIEHILRGMDHLLFVACLVLIAGNWRRILITITGFTIAHSITLTIAALGLVRIPVPPIEAAIALSIVFLAREIAMERRDTLTWRYPIAISSTFGLLHGFGFASALREIGLPQTEIPAALVSFNIGVEIGQITFVCVVIAMVWIVTLLLRQIGRLRNTELTPLDWLRRIEKPFAYAVGSVTVFWTVERVTAFWV